MVVIKNPAKGIMRKHIKEVLKSMTSTERNRQSEHIAEQFLASAPFRMSTRISIYLSMQSEVDTMQILRGLFQHDKQVYIPCYQGSKMCMLRIHDMQDYESLPLTKWQIRQPDAADAARRENANDTGGLDLIVVPGVAFGVKGERLGHGMGYYDKYFQGLFAACPQRASAIEQRGSIKEKLTAGQTVLLGLAFDEQIVDAVPMDDNDVLLDAVLTSTMNREE